MGKKPEERVNFYFDDVDVTKFFNQFYDDDRKASEEESQEKIVVEILREEDCDDGKKCDVDENTLNCWHRISCVFEIVAWLVKNFAFLEEQESDNGNHDRDDGGEEVVHGNG